MPRRAIPTDLDRRVRAAAGDHCGYCRSPQHLVHAPLEIEHILPYAAGGDDREANLWLACPICNRHKSNKTFARDPLTGNDLPPFNPRFQQWPEHFAWVEQGLLIEGRTAVGRAAVIALHLSDDPIALMVRRHWILAGWHPPAD